MRKLILLAFVSFLFAQTVFQKNDQKIFRDKINYANSIQKELSINDLIILIGESFVGTNYVANTLQTDGNEQLIIKLTGLDCYTFVEATIAIARLVKNMKSKNEDFINEITTLRYRDGKLKDYSSRLHYLIDWGYELEQREILKNISKEIGGKTYSKKINFMSNNSNSYKELVARPEFIKDMIEIEKNINQREHYYIPQEDIEKLSNQIKSGDIIGITTNIDGLDVSHTGLAYKKKDGKLYLLHAPTVGRKVQITSQTLSEYIKSNKRQTGIIVYRVN